MTREAGNLFATTDFSKDVVEREVLKNVTSSPLVTVPAALGVVGIAAFAVGAALPPLLMYGLMAGLGVGGTWFAVNYFGRRDTLIAHYLQAMNSATRDQSKQLAEYLIQEFADLGFDRGKEQIGLLQRHLATIKKLLEEKFDKGDVSYEQFLGPAEALVSKTLNVLKDASSQLRANQTYDQSYDRKAAKAKGGNGDVDRRRELYAEGTKHFEELIGKVESAITGLAELTHDVARIGSATESHDDFIKRVREVASRAGLYVDEKRI